MRKLTLLLFLAFCLFAAPGFSQNRAFQNAIHMKLNAIDYGMVFNNEVKIGQGFEFAYLRNIAPALNVGIPIKFGLAKLPETTGNTVISSADLVFRLENIRSESKLIPFAFAGAGYVLEKFENGHAQFPFGAGVHFRISPYSFLSLQGEYRKALTEDRDNIQIGLGFVYLLHKSENADKVEKLSMETNDTDHDGVTNDLDKCPNDPGPAAALGCPDRDNDGIADTEDGCPDDPGTFDTEGCPDYDKDALADKDDPCPTEAGTVNGCPDTDYDGIADKDDKCPGEAGTAANMGCPVAADTDNDGVVDSEDLCPEVAGTIKGCPDTDGDGVVDREDECPDIVGTSKNNGCPEKAAIDSDGDGIPDDMDPCPVRAGSANGCPDADNDGIADQNDKCPDQKGVAANFGCPEVKAPDKDGDGVPDKNDPCPDKAGKVNGCPDRDEDGIADRDDKCPDLPGKDFSGCPDRDGDGIADPNDKCPDLAGTNPVGCPDKDDDGVLDKDDKCPDVAGTVKGCPDGDGDGIADRDDKCPDTAGSSRNGGCPEVTADPDSDGDGVADKNDPCPDKAGKMNGCPDSDGDKVADNLDKCPTTPGPTNNFGCPEVKKETKERLAYAAKAVQFQTGKAILKDESYTILDEMVAIMRENPAYTLSISGYTDDIGTDEENLQLSRDRAKACYDYLIFRGIKTERLRFAGFGEARPIADNKTAEGRELNRRVEFELLLD